MLIFLIEIMKIKKENRPLKSINTTKRKALEKYFTYNRNHDSDRENWYEIIGTAKYLIKSYKNRRYSFLYKIKQDILWDFKLFHK